MSMVSRAHERAGTDPRRRRCTRDRSPALDQAFEGTEAPRGLDELVEAIACVDRGAAIDARRTRPRFEGRSRGVPALAHDDGIEREAFSPAGRFEAGPQRTLVGPADAQVRDRIDPCRDPEERSKVIGAVEAHPPDTESFRARREPQVLDGAGGAVDVGLGNRAAAEDLDALGAVVAADADAERRLDDPFDLLVEEVAGALVEAGGLSQALALGEVTYLDPRFQCFDDDDPPRLHEADGRCAMCGLEKALQDRLGNGIGAEAPDVAPLGDDTVHRFGIRGGEAPTARIGGALSGARRVEPRGRCGSRLTVRAWHADTLPGLDEYSRRDSHRARCPESALVDESRSAGQSHRRRGSTRAGIPSDRTQR